MTISGGHIFDRYWEEHSRRIEEAEAEEERKRAEGKAKRAAAKAAREAAEKERIHDGKAERGNESCNAEQKFVKKKHLTPMPQYSRIAKVGAEKEIHREKKHGENRRTGSAL